MIFEKLQKARVQLQEMKLKKSGKNKFAGFTYYELADFLPAINKIFLELKLSSNFSINDNIAKLTVTDWEDKTQETFTSPVEDLELKGCTKIQALGGVHTYLKRYLYLNALEIVENDMLDPNVGNNGSLEEVVDDERIIRGLNAINTQSTLTSYYKKFENKVNNKEAFIKACTERKAQLNEKA